MKMIIRIIIAFFIMFVVSFNAVAGELTYTCKIIHIYELDKDGSLVISDWEKEFKGSHFIISRSTGEIIGRAVPALLAGSTRIINQGSNEDSFRSIADFENQIQLIEIQEFVPEANKPFIVKSKDGAGIITGLSN
jgi:hypothetical protein|tara:strand:+ start:1327 stop:1731 length:405 start_codon:yes stop_codon:yes gene_type:complete